MRIIKPLRLSLLTRPYTMRRQHRLGISVLAMATLDEHAILLPEADIWRMTSAVLEEDNVVDLAVPKPCAEFLVTGRAWEHGMDGSGSTAAKVRVADCEKVLIVHGDRTQTSSGMTPATPVQGIPVDWSHTYGGADFAENPSGIGAVRRQDGNWVLPNVEPLTNRISSPGQTGQPVSFGPVSPIRPRRFARSGDFDPAWLSDGFPGFPDSMDPYFFNAAEPDQWLTQQDRFEPGTDYSIWNMHPQKQCMRGRLPSWRARCFVTRYQESEVQEVPMRHTTAWFFPEHERVLLMFHGSVETLADDASDIAVIMPALDADESHERDRKHFEQVLKLRLAPGTGPAYALRDRDLLPVEALRAEDFLTDDVMSKPLAVNQKARAKQMREDALDRIKAAGQDPADYGLDKEMAVELNSLDDLPDLLRKTTREARLVKADMLRKRRENERKLKETLGDGAQGAVGRSAMTAAMAEPPGGPPAFNSSVQAKAMVVRAEDSKAERAAAAIGPRTFDQEALRRERDAKFMEPDKIRSMFDKGQEGMARLYLTSAHLQTSAPPALPGRSVRMRRRVLALMQGSRDLSGLDLTGVDLSGLDLSGARCRGTWMEMADLTGVQMVDADLSETVLTRALLQDTNMSGAVLKGANLGGALARNASFERAVFDETILDEAVFSACRFDDAVMRQCTAAEVDFSDCQFSGTHIHSVTFWREAQFTRVRFEHAELERVVWLECGLDAVEYPHTKLTACAWVQSQCISPLSFEHGHLVTCGVVQTDMPGAVFTNAWVHESSLRGIDLDGARFDGARLQSSDFSESSLREASFRRCDAGGSLLMECDLTGADMRESDLIDAIASKSDFRFADLSDTNLFRADISQSILDASTRSANAYVKWAKTLPAAPGESA